MAAHPFTIDAVLGQEKAKKMLRRAVRGNRLSHAYLFRGPAGVGKRTLARAFGNYLNCENPAGQDACTACRSCQKLKSGNHPDLLIIEPDGASIKIDQVRALKHALTFPPFETACRIVLITAVHMLRPEAANSLLKTLEEPPPGNLLILIGDEASEILPTITSRCQIIPFSGLPRQLVEEVLTAEGLSAEAAASLAAITNGSLGQARVLAELEILETRRAIIIRLLELGPDNRAAVETVFLLAEQAVALNDRLPDLLDLIKLWFRDLVMLGAGLPGQIRNRDLAEATARAAARWSQTELLERLALFDKARAELARNCNRALVCEALFFGLL